jgi:hypothetical protein
MSSGPDVGYQQRRGTSLAGPFRRSTPRGHRHHVGVALEEEERHVKPGAELPDVKGHELVESCFSADSNPMVKLLMSRSV